jgi:hypothetical protein
MYCTKTNGLQTHCVAIVHNVYILFKYKGGSSQTKTFNFTGIKRDASMAVLNEVVSGKWGSRGLDWVCRGRRVAGG